MSELPEPLNRLDTAARREYTACGDGTIVWHQWGEGAPLLLLHGGSGSWTHWVRNIDALVDQGYRVIAPDLPGFGDSAGPPGGNDVDVMPEPMNAGLRQLIGNTQCPVVGFSFGAMLGTLMAAQANSQISALIMAGAPALSDMRSPRITLRAWEKLPSGTERNTIMRANLRALMLARDESVDELAITIQALNVPRDRLRFRRLARTDIVVRTLPRVTCPVAGIWGSKDAVYHGQMDTIEPGLAQAPAYHSLTVIPNAGHWVQYERSNAFNETLIRLLSNEIQTQAQSTPWGERT